jgi:hypothetical protein
MNSRRRIRHALKLLLRTAYPGQGCIGTSPTDLRPTPPTVRANSSAGSTGITPQIPVWDKSNREDGTFSRSDFTFDRDRNVYVCPADKLLKTTGNVGDEPTPDTFAVDAS